MKRPRRMTALGRRQPGLTLMEILISIVILSVVTTLILVAYFALNNSYSYSIASGKARENARQALARMSREIRDMEVRLDLAEAAIVRAREKWVLFYTTFNEAGNSDPSMAPGLVMYRLYNDAEIWRFEDVNRDGDIANIDENTYPSTLAAQGGEQAGGEGARLLVANVINYGGTVSPAPCLFQYSLVAADGQLELDPEVYYTENRSRILTVQIHMLVDLNPYHSPVYADLLTSAQLRNQRLY